MKKFSISIIAVLAAIMSCQHDNKVSVTSDTNDSIVDSTLIFDYTSVVIDSTLDARISEASDSLLCSNLYPEYEQDPDSNAHCYTVWYDSLTVLVAAKLNTATWSYEPTDQLLHNAEFLDAMAEGFDGLCLVDATPELREAISYFWGSYNNCSWKTVH